MAYGDVLAAAVFCKGILHFQHFKQEKIQLFGVWQLVQRFFQHVVFLADQIGIF